MFLWLYLKTTNEYVYNAHNIFVVLNPLTKIKHQNASTFVALKNHFTCAETFFAKTEHIKQKSTVSPLKYIFQITNSEWSDAYVP